MDVREKLVEICFHEFCMVAGDSPCGCDGCPYGKYGSDDGECYVEYKKDKIEKLENDMDKYQKEDNGVTVQEWISVKDRLPDAGGYVVCIAKRNPFSRFMPMVARIEKNGWVNPMTEQYISEVTHWMPLPNPPKGE